MAVARLGSADRQVASRAEAWIETMTVYAMVEDTSSRLPRGGVD